MTVIVALPFLFYLFYVLLNFLYQTGIGLGIFIKNIFQLIL